MYPLTSYEQLKVRVQLVRDSPAIALPKIQFDSAKDVYDLLKEEVLTWDREKFLSLMLNSRNLVIAIDEVGIGSLNKTIVHPREVFKSAILANAAGVILVHNHPSEDPTPSADDKRMTEQLYQAAKVLDISLCDHIIIAKHGYSSWLEGWASHTALSDVLPF
jgi:DNA repair protein RadC